MTTTMNVLHGRIGGEFSLGEAEVPTPAHGQVRVRIRAAAFNYVDQMMLAGVYDNVPGGPEGPAPYVAGVEFTGEVDAIGPAVQGRAVGDRVVGMAPGAFAEYIVIDAGNLAALPDAVGWTDAAALQIALCISHDALVTRGGMQEGASVLVNGGTTGIGSLAIQVAKSFGAGTVLATTRKAGKKDALRGLGADHVIATDEEDLTQAVLNATGGQGADLVLDALGGSAFSAAIPATRVGGKILCLGTVAGAEPSLNLATVAVRLITIIGSAFDSRPVDDRMAITSSVAALFPYVLDGRIRPVIDSIHSFPGQATEAIARLSAHDAVGKIVFEMP
ncbi:zinc-binding dehydrogenase [Streptomyces sp. NPDC046821]|uniref:quinone oxidoreductase family protein n=1 Tax=Streptomyces sp. NPDC046821 TaxID=3154702 RepID=UPI0033CC3611